MLMMLQKYLFQLLSLLFMCKQLNAGTSGVS